MPLDLRGRSFRQAHGLGGRRVPGFEALPGGRGARIEPPSRHRAATWTNWGMSGGGEPGIFRVRPGQGWWVAWDSNPQPTD